ncbi:putative selenium-dependent hydroxylase accessory protein YqeC [Acidaminobacter sp. JC074]|uniref:selenium cofactor biosynthesis protein YqeC n=1 Tax=Acidaminobacter sp. JC074 TaxID=2530199 RepID=UPI001F0E4D1F|nr:selenium cofactor biosynthesis protein YqeC [Acidaminobacter sp. JC074]MCH4890102.1 putative selenium-dependent hydroxylase accessory protein YqeC [Acidaminobacter sp. JC074]
MDNYLIDEILDIKTHTKLITFVGGGGKTTSIYKIAQTLKKDHTVLVTTTTHMFHPHDQVDRVYFGDLPDEVESNIVGLFTLYDPVKNKVKGISKDQVNGIKDEKKFDLILNEGDGSKSRPLKSYGHHEPVIPSSSDMVVIVIGAEVFNQPLSEDLVHRIDPFMTITGLKEGQIIRPDAIIDLLTHQDGFLKNLPDHAKAYILINKAKSYSVDIEGFSEKLFLKTNRYKAVISGEMAKFEILRVIEYDR